MSDQPFGVEIDGEQLRHLRKLAGHNLVTFAEKLGISWGYLSQIERGHRKNVSPAVFARICDELGVENRAELVKVPAA